jgi:O-antigen ligase
MKRLMLALDAVNYWAIIILPFSVAIAPGVANTVIGLMCASFIIGKVLKKEKPFTVTPAIAIFWVFMFLGLLSFFNTVSLEDSLDGMVKLLKFFLIFVVSGECIKDKKHFKIIAVSAACGITLTGIDGLWQLFSGKDFIHGNSLQEAVGVKRVTGPFPGCNAMGVYLAGLTPFILGLALFSTRLRLKTIFFAASVFGGIGAYLTFSRGALLGIIMAAIFLVIINKNKLMISLLIAMFLVFPFVIPKNVKDWAKSVNYNPVIMLTCQTRLSIYRNTLNMIRHHPLLGVGINTFSRNYGKYRLAEVEANFQTADGYYAHNNFLHMAGETGLPSLAVFLAFLVIVFGSIWGSFKRISDPFLRACSISVFAALIAYLVNGFTETNLYYSRIVMIFWFLIGLGLALSRFEDKRGPA